MIRAATCFALRHETFFGNYGRMKTAFGRCVLAMILMVLPVGVSGAATQGDRLSLGNEYIIRELTFDGHVWRTTRFARGDGSDALVVKSDEVHVLFLDDSEVSLD